MLPGKVTGVDRNAGKLAVQRQRCKQSVDLILCDLSDGGKPNLSNSFDSVVCNNVLEHLDNPGGVIQWMSDCLVPDGLLIATVPDSSSKLTSVVEKLYGKVMPKAYASEHCYEFTPSNLDAMSMASSLVFIKGDKIFTDMVRVYQKKGVQ
jgi:SAM-dependent methyltransferase